MTTGGSCSICRHERGRGRQEGGGPRQEVSQVLDGGRLRLEVPVYAPGVCARACVRVCVCPHTLARGAQQDGGCWQRRCSRPWPCTPRGSPAVPAPAQHPLHTPGSAQSHCSPTQRRARGCRVRQPGVPHSHTHTQGTCTCTGAPPDSVRLCAPPAPLQWPWCTGGKKRQPPKFFGRDAFLGILTAAVMGLQHAMAMLAGLTTVPYLIGNNAYNVSGAC